MRLGRPGSFWSILEQKSRFDTRRCSGARSVPIARETPVRAVLSSKSMPCLAHLSLEPGHGGLIWHSWKSIWSIVKLDPEDATVPMICFQFDLAMLSAEVAHLPWHISNGTQMWHESSMKTNADFPFSSMSETCPTCHAACSNHGQAASPRHA